MPWRERASALAECLAERGIIVGVDELSRGAPVPEGSRELSQITQTRRVTTVRPDLKFTDPIVR
jgi:hypothetical protein